MSCLVRASTVSCRPSRTGSWRCARRGQCLGASADRAVIMTRLRALTAPARSAFSRIYVIDVQGILAFAERVLPRAADLWVQASLDQKQRLQQLFLPEGVAFDGNRFNRTAATAPFFKYLAPSEGAEERMVSPRRIEPTRQERARLRPRRGVCPARRATATASATQGRSASASSSTDTGTWKYFISSPSSP